MSAYEEKKEEKSEDTKYSKEYRALLAENLPKWKIPRDSEGYVKTFDINESAPEEIQEFFKEYGLVCISNLLDKSEEIDASVDETYRYVEDWYSGFQRNDTKSWENIRGLGKNLGMIGNTPVLTRQICENRQNPAIVKAFRIILEEEKIYVNMGRIGYFRPTKKITFKYDDLQAFERAIGSHKSKIKMMDKDSLTLVMDRPDWQTVDGHKWLHLDMDPVLNKGTTFGFMPTEEYERGSKEKLIDPYRRPRVQGVMALSDCSQNNGGFLCVPGFVNIFDEWTRIQRECIDKRLHGHRIQFATDDPILEYTQKISLRPGSMVIWNCKTAHASYANDGEGPRLVQYIRFARHDDPMTRPVELGREVTGPWGMSSFTCTFADDFELTELGREIYGLNLMKKKEKDGQSNEWSCRLL